MLNIELIKQIDDISLEVRKLLKLPVETEQFSAFQQVTFDELSDKIKNVFSDIEICSDNHSSDSYMVKLNKSDAESKFEIHVGTDMSPEERIDSLMHEMAHFVLHAENLEPNIPIGKYTGTVYQENEANCFSRAFLLPETFFIKALILFSKNDGSVAIDKLANYFKVQENLIIERGRDLMVWN